MVLFMLSEQEFEALGLELAGFDATRQARTCAATNRARFRASYGASPKAYHATIFWDFQTTEIEEALIEIPNPQHFLMSLNWLKTCKTERQMAGHFNCDEKMAVWEYTAKVSALKSPKVRSFGIKYLLATTNRNQLSLISSCCFELPHY
jgi:hypothetical protein